MDYQEKAALVRRICNRKLYGKITYNQREYSVIFEDPTIDLMSQADAVYKKEYDYLRNNTDIFTIEESYQILKERGKWDDKLEKKMIDLTKDVTTLSKGLNKLKFNKTAERATKKTLEQGKKELEELFLIKNQLRPYTVESLAEKFRRRFLIKNIAKIDSSPELLENSTFKDHLIVYYFEESSILDSKIRELARSDPWRLYWVTSKDTGTPLFPHSCVECTELESSLILWTRIYDFAYASSNRPTDDVINDDELFDAWYKEECDKAELETKKNQLEGIGGSGKMEVFIPADLEGAKEVYALNDKMAKARIEQRQKFIEQKGEVKEQALPDVKAELEMQINRMNSEAIKNRSK